MTRRRKQKRSTGDVVVGFILVGLAAAIALTVFLGAAAMGLAVLQVAG